MIGVSAVLMATTLVVSATEAARAPDAIDRAGSTAAEAPHTSTQTAPAAKAVIKNRTRYRPTVRIPAPPRIAGRSWAAVDLRTGNVLAVHRPRVRLAPGSTMKVLTAITAVRRLAPTPRHRVTRREAGMECSCAGLIAGRRYARRDLLAGLLMPSGNDAAEAIAGSDPVSRGAFIGAMNGNARRLHLPNTHAGNPSGLDHPGGFTSAKDLLTLLRVAYRNDRVAPYLDLRRTTFGPVGGPRKVIEHGTPYVRDYRNSIAAKSGTTSRAGKVLVAFTRVDGRVIGVALMNSPGDRVTTDLRAMTYWLARYRERLLPVGHLP